VARKKDFDTKTTLLIIMSLICGSLITYVLLSYSSSQKESNAYKSQNFSKLSDHLIELNSYNNSGINQEQWTNVMRELQVVASKYKISNRPSKVEAKLLDDILSNMRKTQDMWRINEELSYGCFAKTPSDKCFLEYSAKLYQLNVSNDKNIEQYTKEIKSIVQNDYNNNIKEHHSGMISLWITLVTMSINNFFEFHNISI